VKQDCKSIRDAVAKGIDPITLPLEGGRIGNSDAKGKAGASDSYFHSVTIAHAHSHFSCASCMVLTRDARNIGVLWRGMHGELS
jgi:hypothetical protein